MDERSKTAGRRNAKGRRDARPPRARTKGLLGVSKDNPASLVLDRSGEDSRSGGDGGPIAARRRGGLSRVRRRERVGTGAPIAPRDSAGGHQTPHRRGLAARGGGRRGRGPSTPETDGGGDRTPAPSAALANQRRGARHGRDYRWRPVRPGRALGVAGVSQPEPLGGPAPWRGSIRGDGLNGPLACHRPGRGEQRERSAGGIIARSGARGH